MLNQVKDTLTTARDLLRSKQESSAQAAAAGASSGSVSTIPSSLEPSKDKTLRAGEFLHSAGTAPGGQFETDSDVHESLAPTAAEPVDPLKDLEPMAATVAASVADAKSAPAPPPAPPPPPVPSEPRGLEWYLKTRAGATSTPGSAPAPPPRSPPENPNWSASISLTPRPLLRIQAMPRNGLLPKRTRTSLTSRTQGANRNREQSRREKRNSSPTSTAEAPAPKKSPARVFATKGQSSVR